MKKTANKTDEEQFGFGKNAYAWEEGLSFQGLRLW